MANKTRKHETEGRPPRGRKHPRKRSRKTPAGGGEATADTAAATDAAAQGSQAGAKDESDRASRPGGRKPRKESAPELGAKPAPGASGSPQDQGATGRSMAGTDLVPQPHGGALMVHPPGSNGGVHRGPDKFLRRNTIRVMFLGALADAGLSLEDLESFRKTRKHRKGATLVPMAMVDHCKTAFKNIALAAASGDQEAFGPFLRMMADAHEFLQPAKDEAGERVPVPAKFVYSSATPEPPVPSPDPPGRPPAPGTLLDAHGQEYVEA